MTDLLETVVMETISNTPNLRISLNTNLRHFRTAKEIAKDGHGNYIYGNIEFNPPPIAGQVNTFQYFKTKNLFPFNTF